MERWDRRFCEECWRNGDHLSYIGCLTAVSVLPFCLGLARVVVRLRNTLRECDGLALTMSGLGSTVFGSHLLGEGFGLSWTGPEG